MPRRMIFVVLAAALSAAPAFAAARKPQPRTGIAGLFSRIAAYINSEPVLKSRVTAVAAVRGGIPTDQGEDLDQRLMDRAAALRERLLPAADARDEAALRKVYQALSISQLVQAMEMPLEPGMRDEARAAVQAWSGLSHNPALPPSLKAYLAAPPDKPSDKALVAAGWASWVRKITPEPAAKPAPRGAPRVAQPETARLDEAWLSLRRTWTERAIAEADAAKAHFLAGFVYAELARARYQGVAPAEPEASAAGPDDAAPAAPAPRKIVAAPAPADDADEPFNPRAVYAKASKSVVLIVCSSQDGAGELGSGSFIDESGRILTNAHVVIRDSTRQPWQSIRVYTKPERLTGDATKDLVTPRPAAVVSADNGLDLAVIRIEPVPGFPPLSLANPDDVEIGDKVAAIGHPEQGGLWTLTTGVVSTLVANMGNVKGKNVFQTDASINRGNSGGPLLNGAGDIIGVNTLMARKAADGLAITSVNYAVKSDVARRWLAKAAGVSLDYASRAAAAAPAGAAAPAPAVEAGVPEVRVIETASPRPGGKKVRKEAVSESKPFRADDVIEAAIKEMEELGDEMRQEIDKKRSNLNP